MARKKKTEEPKPDLCPGNNGNEPQTSPHKGRQQTLPQSESFASGCPKCGSSNRGAYRGTPRTFHLGIKRHAHFGVIYDTILKRWTSCRDCGQRYVNTEYRMENFDG